MQTPFTWTNPFHGVSHLNHLPRLCQVTIEDYGAHAEPGKVGVCQVTHWIPNRDQTGKQAVETVTVLDGIDAAKRIGEDIGWNLRRRYGF